ncbi:hypothetical protein LIER_18678 [Lithospermum erythrorhizon]|uniref:Uncharacterized protein n=1 Tax=Lithospermum erythrorhizon TaxID=34254 RepID=A0AAV3QEV6_LITER
MIELTSAKQCQEEPVTDYINRRRSLSLKWILAKTFEHLSTRAHDMELTIVANKGKGASTTAGTSYKAKYKAKKPREAS